MVRFGLSKVSRLVCLEKEEKEGESTSWQDGLFVPEIPGVTQVSGCRSHDLRLFVGMVLDVNGLVSIRAMSQEM